MIILSTGVFISITSKKQLVNNPVPKTDEEIANFKMKKGMYCMCEMTITKVSENQIMNEPCVKMLPDVMKWKEEDVIYQNCFSYCEDYVNKKL